MKTAKIKQENRKAGEKPREKLSLKVNVTADARLKTNGINEV